MTGPEGYKGSDIGEKQGLENKPLLNDTPDKQENDTKAQQKQLDSQTNQVSVKVAETIDTFEEQSKTKLTDQQKQDISKLLLDSSSKLPSQKGFLDKVLEYTKAFGNEINLESFNDIIKTVGEEFKNSNEVDKAVNKEDKKVNETNSIITNRNEKKEVVVESNTDTEKDKEKIKITEKNTTNLNNLKSSLGSLDKNNPNYGSLVGKINTLVSENGYTEELFDEIMGELKNPDTLSAIATDLKTQSPAKYENFKANLINIDSSFRESFDDIETGFHNAGDLVKVGTDTNKGLDKKGDIITQSKDGINTEVDDGDRKLSLNDSDYKLESPLENDKVEDEINDKKEEFTDFMEGKNEELNNLSSMMDYIDTAINNNLEISVVKEELKDSNNDVYNELHLDGCNDLQEIKNLLAGAYKQKDEEKKEFIKKAKAVVDEIVSKNALEAKEKDKQVQDTLKFLSSIGFDQIPQDVSDSIIETINNGNLLSTFGLQNKIDLKNGNLGVNQDNDKTQTGFKEKSKFMEFVNILLSGDKTKPIDINSITLGEPIFKNDSGQIITNKNSYIKSHIGANPKLFILSNMDKYRSSK